jgi:hypothetical protein
METLKRNELKSIEDVGIEDVSSFVSSIESSETLTEEVKSPVQVDYFLHFSFLASTHLFTVRKVGGKWRKDGFSLRSNPTFRGQCATIPNTGNLIF